MAGGVFCGYNAVSATKEIAIVLPKHVLFALMGLGLAGCETPEPEPPEYRPRKVVELERWQVRAGDSDLGELVKFEIQDPEGPVLFYRVLDERGRWVGHADANGRFSRRVPFQEEEQDLGVWSLQRGCALLFESEQPVTLAVKAAEADFEKGR